MGYETNIGWTQATVNFWMGCRKVSEGCRYCYMYRDMEKYGRDPHTVVRCSDDTFYKALKWKEPRLIFTCSWSDFFIEEADAWRADAWDVIRRTPQHTWQILTKRPERIAECLPPDWGDGYPNVWLGVSAEDQASANERIPYLLSVPAKVRFVSCEPLLGPIDLEEVSISVAPGFFGSPLRWHHMGKCYEDEGIPYPTLDWIIIGGESGNETGKYLYRPCELDWLGSLVDQCKSAGVAVFVKQLGTAIAKDMKLSSRAGSDPAEFPVQIQVQEMP